MRELDAANRRAQELLDKGDFGNALKAFLDVKEQAAKLGIDASWPCWGIAICHDNMGDHAMAFESMRESLRVDPLNIGKQESYDMIVQHLRAALSARDRATEDASTPRLYALLVQAGEADVGAHLAMARHLAATTDHARAMRILDAVTTLNPANREAWERKAAVARTMGDAPLAHLCEAEAAACPTGSAPFGLPRAVAAC